MKSWPAEGASGGPCGGLKKKETIKPKTVKP